MAGVVEALGAGVDGPAPGTPVVVDVAFEVAGSPQATEQAIRVVRPGGTLVLLG